MKRSVWRLFPIALLGGLGVTVAANAVMIYAALDTFPGKADDGGYALSNHYDAVLARAERDLALGWTIAARADQAGHAWVTLVDHGGAPLPGASITAIAERPLGDRDRLALAFREAEPGQYVADVALPGEGQWELTLSASIGGRDVAATRRVLVR